MGNFQGLGALVTSFRDVHALHGLRFYVSWHIGERRAIKQVEFLRRSGWIGD